MQTRGVLASLDAAAYVRTVSTRAALKYKGGPIVHCMRLSDHIIAKLSAILCRSHACMPAVNAHIVLKEPQGTI